MRPYEYQLTERSIQAQTLTLAFRSGVLERIVGLVFLSLFWGFILYLALAAALS